MPRLAFRCVWALLLIAPALTVQAEEEAATNEKPAAAEKPAGADAAAEKPRFLRLTRDEKKTPQALETAIVTYVPVDPAKGDITVELVGAVHIGDKAYYEALNKEFEQYDALLYELVAPENTKVPKERKGVPGSAVGGLQ